MAKSNFRWRGWLLAALVVWAGIPAADSSIQAQTLDLQNWNRSQAETTIMHPTGLAQTQALTGTWQTEVANIQPLDGFIKTATLDPNGDLYFAGNFTQIAGVKVNGIVRWDGTTWSALPSTQFDWTTWFPSFQSLAFVDDNLYAGGAKTNIGGHTGLDLARWDGATWHATGSGVGSTGGIEQLAQYADELYILGSFTSFNGVRASDLVRWNGTTVTSMTTILEQMNVMVATSAGVYISGFNLQNDLLVDHVLHWDGTSFTSLPLEVEANSIRVFNDQLYGAQSNDQTSVLKRWNGTAWVTVVDAVPGLILDYALDSDQIYVEAQVNGQIQLYSYVGNALQLLTDCECTDAYRLYLAHNRLFMTSATDHSLLTYVNNQWQAIPLYRAPDLALTTGADAAYILDDQLLSWENNTWRAIPQPTSHLLVDDLQAADDRSLYVIANNQANEQIVYRYVQGAAEVTILPTIPATPLSELFVINGQTPLVRTNTEIYRWNGASWDSLALPPHNFNPGIDLFGYNQQLYALVASLNNGRFTSVIYRWNGTAWVEPTAPVAGFAVDLAANADGLYLAGQFEHAGEDYQLINWDGNQFNFISSSNKVIDQVAATADGVYVGGWFSQLGDCACYNLGYWNGSTWQAVGGGTNGRVADLALSNQQLFVHGSFSQTGNATALGLAIWNPTSTYTVYLPFTRK